MSTAARRPAGATVPTDAASSSRVPPITGAADILCDRSGRLGLLSYLVPDTMKIRPGDCVEIPFGTRTKYGMVVSASTSGKATREILSVVGKRAAPADLALARSVARFHFAPESAVYPRLAPTSGKAAPPLNDFGLRLRDDLPPTPTPVGAPPDAPRRLLVRAPLVDPAVLAAREAARIAETTGGQVLVLCPTAELVGDVYACFDSGAQRLDAKAGHGAWGGFRDGLVRVGVGTRSAALYSAARLAGIVVVDEEHPAHLEARLPHTNARDLASARSRSLRIALTLISANPTPQALGCGVSVFTAGGRSDWPRMRLIDRGDLDPVTRWAPPQLTAAIAGEERQGRTPVVVVQRKEAVRRCVRCREPRPCSDCESSLCRHPETSACPRCDVAAGVRMTGWDKTRVSDLLGGRARAVTLTELASVQDAGLVVIFDLDAALSAAELVTDTLAGGLLVSAARAAGRGGAVIALTDQPDHPLVANLFGPRDLLAMCRQRLADAKAAGLPPFGRLVTVRCGQKEKPAVSRWPGLINGPRRVGDEWELIVRIPSGQLMDLEPHLTRLRRKGKTRVTVT